jgi:pimeloyl-ACP methyl ester carboxylesterase
VRVPAGINARDIDVRGIRTRVFEVDPGNGVTPLILLHGGGLDSALVSYGSAILAINPGGITDRFRFMRTVEWLVRHPALQRRMYRLSVSLGRGLIRLQLRAGLGMTNAAALTDGLIDAVVVSGKRPRAGEAFAATQRWAFADPANLSLMAKLPQIEAETLMLAGRDDKLVPVADSIRASQAVPHGQLRVLAPCGHWLVRDRPVEFADAVNEFLDAAK